MLDPSQFTFDPGAIMKIPFKTNIADVLKAEEHHADDLAGMLETM